MQRKFLAFILKLLSKWAIKKHRMKIIVVAGMHGTKVTGELIAGMLQPDYVVRRQLEVPFWDFSIPLAILGETDKKYSLGGWVKLIIANIFRLIFGKSNFTWTILQMNTFRKEIASYWMDILQPEVTILVNVEDEPRILEELLARKTKEFLIIPSDINEINELKRLTKAKTFVSGSDLKCDLSLKFNKDLSNGTALTFIDYEGNILEFFAFQKGQFMLKPLIAVISALIAMDFDIEDVQERLARTEIDLERFLLNKL